MAVPTTNAQILKARHSLIGKSLIPVINQVKVLDESLPLPEFARLKRGHPIENYTLNELHQEFERLTGDTIKDVVPLTGKPDDLNTARLLIHFAVLQANIVGAPRGQVLEPGPNTANLTSTSPPSLPSLSATSSATQPTVTADSNKRPHKDMEERMLAMEDSINSFKAQKREIQVEEALRHIRILASRPKLTAPHVLIAAVESLVEVATKASHKELDYFVKSLSYCRKYETSDDLCGLALKLFGSSEDKKIATAVNEWAKGRKYEGSQEFKQDVLKPNYSPNFMYPPNFVPPFMPYHMPPYNFPFQRGNGRGRGRGRRSNKSSCFYCKEDGHFVSNCPKLSNQSKAN